MTFEHVFEVQKYRKYVHQMRSMAEQAIRGFLASDRLYNIVQLERRPTAIFQRSVQINVLITVDAATASTETH